MINKSTGSRGSRFSLQSSPPGRRQRIFASIGASPGTGFAKQAMVKKANNNKPNIAGSQAPGQPGNEA